MNILKTIFKNHYEEMLYILHPRPVFIVNVEKIINCGDPSFDGTMYERPHCGEFKFVPFRCHSKFCPTCGNKCNIERSTNMSFNLIRCSHRHCVFTIDETLRHFFGRPLSFKLLFLVVRNVILHLFLRKTNRRTLFPALFASFILSGNLLNGIQIFTVALLKVASLMMVSGVL